MEAPLPRKLDTTDTISLAGSSGQSKAPDILTSESTEVEVIAEKDVPYHAEEPIARVPPDGGREAWTQVAASFLINMNVYGLVNAFGEFQHFYETEYLISYSSSSISWIGTFQGSLILLVGALAGPIFDKGHFMITLKLASFVLVVCWMLLSVSSQYYQVSIMTKSCAFQRTALYICITISLLRGVPGCGLTISRSCLPKVF